MVPNWLESDYDYYSPKSYLLGHLQQISENTLRLKYNYNRQVETEYAFNYLEENFNYTKEYIEKLLSIYNYSYPDLAAEITINEHCTARWKKEILELELKDYDNLVSRNRKNPSLFRLLHSCAKNCIKQDKKTKGLEFIILSMLNAPKIKNRPSLTSTEIKILFRNENEKVKFEKFVKGLNKETEDSDIKNFAENFYYKNVVLSQDAINEANQKHKAISSKVGVYLKDDEDESKSEKTYKKKKKPSLGKILNSSDKAVELTKDETIIINFIKDKSEVSIEEATLFSKNNSLRLKKIVNAVNKKSFEAHEESLIILDEDSYTLNTEILEEISS